LRIFVNFLLGAVLVLTASRNGLEACRALRCLLVNINAQTFIRRKQLRSRCLITLRVIKLHSLLKVAGNEMSRKEFRPVTPSIWGTDPTGIAENTPLPLSEIKRIRIGSGSLHQAILEN